MLLSARKRFMFTSPGSGPNRPPVTPRAVIRPALVQHGDFRREGIGQDNAGVGGDDDVGLGALRRPMSTISTISRFQTSLKWVSGSSRSRGTGLPPQEKDDAHPAKQHLLAVAELVVGDEGVVRLAVRRLRAVQALDGQGRLVQQAGALPIPQAGEARPSASNRWIGRR